MTTDITDDRPPSEALPVSFRSSSCVLEYKRILSIIPYRTETETIRFSSDELAALYQDLRRTIAQLEDERNVLEQQRTSHTERIKSLERSLSDNKKILSENKRLSQRIGNLEADRKSLTASLANERRKNQSSLSTLQSKEREVSKLNQTLEVKQLELKQASSEFGELRHKSQLTIKSLEEKVGEMQHQLERSDTALDLVSRVREIPYGVERVLEKLGKTTPPAEPLQSHPPLTGPRKKHHRRSVANEGLVLRALCMAKDRSNVKTSQDALAYTVQNGELYAAITDGVSSSHRQAEWAHRVARASLSSSPLSEIVKAQEVHTNHAKTLFDLVDPRLQWMEEEKMNNPGQATLLTVESNGDTILLKRCGDTWAAAFRNGAWDVILSPSTVAATNAISSNLPPRFDNELTIEKPDRLLVMTDGVLGQSKHHLEQLWIGLCSQTDDDFSVWLQSAETDGLFDLTDDVTALAISFDHDAPKGLETS